MALGKYKLSYKDLKQVVKTHPNSSDARVKLKICEKAVREAAFAAAIMKEPDDPLCSRIVIDDISELSHSHYILFTM